MINAVVMPHYLALGYFNALRLRARLCMRGRVRERMCPSGIRRRGEGEREGEKGRRGGEGE